MTRQRGELLHFFFNMARGKWRDNQHVEIHQTDKAVLHINTSGKRLKAVLDGELIGLEPKTVFEIHPKALRVVVPAGLEASAP
jgi:diacylglycerol kinase family enzyme